MKVYLVIAKLFLGSLLFSQSLFESSLNINQEKKTKYDLNGYVKSFGYFGNNYNSDISAKSAFGELGLQIQVSKDKFGKAYADLRIKEGVEFDKKVNDIVLREAFVQAGLTKNINITIGRQIIVWGRADGFNPTDNITPKNYVIRTPEYDDIREANFIIQTKINIAQEYIFNALFIPIYKGNTIPFEIADFPAGVSFYPDNLSETKIENAAFACKFDFIFSKFDGSFSYFNGYSIDPGLFFGIPVFDTTGNYSVDLSTKIFKQQVIGVDFSSSIGNYGLRGEFAYKTRTDFENNAYVPFPELDYVIGIDRTFTNFNIIAQYIGKYIPDYIRLDKPQNPLLLLNYQENFYNHLIFQQTHEITHSISLRPYIDLFYQSLQVEMFGLYNFSTEEAVIMPKIKYQLTDALDLYLGIDLYFGNDNTLNDLISKPFNNVYLGLKTIF